MPKQPMLYGDEEFSDPYAISGGGFHLLRAIRCSALLPRSSPGDRKVQCQNAFHRHPRCCLRNTKDSDTEDKWLCVGAVPAGQRHNFYNDSEVAIKEATFVAKYASHLVKGTLYPSTVEHAKTDNSLRRHRFPGGRTKPH